MLSISSIVTHHIVLQNILPHRQDPNTQYHTKYIIISHNLLGDVHFLIYIYYIFNVT